MLIVIVGAMRRRKMRERWKRKRIKFHIPSRPNVQTLMAFVFFPFPSFISSLRIKRWLMFSSTFNRSLTWSIELSKLAAMLVVMTLGRFCFSVKDPGTYFDVESGGDWKINFHFGAEGEGIKISFGKNVFGFGSKVGRKFNFLQNALHECQKLETWESSYIPSSTSIANNLFILYVPHLLLCDFPGWTLKQLSTHRGTKESFE